MRARLLLLLILAGSVATSRALIVAGGDGTENTTAPGGGVPWNNVGRIGGATGVYLGAFGGGYWVATATHVGAGNITLGSTTYTLASGSAVQVGNSDLTLFRITSDPGLSNLTLASSAPAAASSVYMIGSGATHGANGTTWFVDTSTDPYTWSTSNFSGADTLASGYTWTGGGAMRWGTNTIEAGTTTYDIGTGVTNALVTDFDLVSGQAQGAVGDSGGAAFAFNGTSWELVGILGAIASFSGQPSSTAVEGNLTYLINLASYNGAIVSAIPEPAEVAAWMGFSAIGAVAWARRKKAVR